MHFKQWFVWGMALAIAALAGCGGGGNSSSGGTNSAGSGSGSGSANSAGNGASANVMSISGTVATGLAMANATVSIQCASGSQGTQAGANGTYKLSVSNASLPCLIEARDATNTLHSVVEGSGSSNATLIVNINPVTELIVAQAVGNGDTATAFQTIGSSRDIQGMLGTIKVSDAVQVVKTQLSPVDASIANTDFLKTKTVAATGSTPGDAMDQLLDKLVAAVKTGNPSGNSAATLSQQIAVLANTLVSSGASTNTGGSAAVAAELMPPPVTSCPVLRNVTYRIVGSNGGYGTASLDWSKGKLIASWSGSITTDAYTISLSNASSCQFSMTNSSGAGLDAVAAPSGLLVLRAGGSAGVGILFPEQSLMLADLAGTWNILDYAFSQNSSSSVNENFELSLDANGQVTAYKVCSGVVDASKVCADAMAKDQTNANPPVHPVQYSVASDGGFTVTKSDKTTGRAFVYRNSSGGVVMVLVNPATGGVAMTLGAKQTRLPLPALNAVSKYWNVTVQSQYSYGFLSYVVPALSTNQITVQSEDVVNSKIGRVRSTGSGGADTLTFNQPRNGLGSSAAAGSSSVMALEMPIPGMGLAVSTSPGGASGTSNFITLSVTMP
jgi:hypothetical protein